MTKPTPQPLDPARLTELALAVVRADRFPFLATIAGDQPCLRPVSPVRTDGFTVYVANLRSYHKTAEIAANPKVELGYLDDNHNQVRLTGVPGCPPRKPAPAPRPAQFGPPRAPSALVSRRGRGGSGTPPGG